MQQHEWKRPGLPMLASEEIEGESSRSTVAGCLDALWAAEFGGTERYEPMPGLEAQVRDLSRAARAAGMLPEQFITVVKESWAAQPQVRAAADTGVVRERLAGIITACIREFFLD